MTVLVFATMVSTKEDALANNFEIMCGVKDK